MKKEQSPEREPRDAKKEEDPKKTEKKESVGFEKAMEEAFGENKPKEAPKKKKKKPIVKPRNPVFTKLASRVEKAETKKGDDKDFDRKAKELSEEVMKAKKERKRLEMERKEREAREEEEAKKERERKAQEEQEAREEKKRKSRERKERKQRRKEKRERKQRRKESKERKAADRKKEDEDKDRQDEGEGGSSMAVQDPNAETDSDEKREGRKESDKDDKSGSDETKLVVDTEAESDESREAGQRSDDEGDTINIPEFRVMPNLPRPMDMDIDDLEDTMRRRCLGYWTEVVPNTGTRGISLVTKLKGPNTYVSAVGDYFGKEMYPVYYTVGDYIIQEGLPLVRQGEDLIRDAWLVENNIAPFYSPWEEKLTEFEVDVIVPIVVKELIKSVLLVDDVRSRGKYATAKVLEGRGYPTIDGDSPAKFSIPKFELLRCLHVSDDPWYAPREMSQYNGGLSIISSTVNMIRVVRLNSPPMRVYYNPDNFRDGDFDGVMLSGMDLHRMRPDFVDCVMFVLFILQDRYYASDMVCYLEENQGWIDHLQGAGSSFFSVKEMSSDSD